VAAVPSIGRATRVERSTTPGAAAAGDLYERYSAQILGYCMHQLGSREEAEDAVQTTFMNAFRGLQRGIVPELESAWLFKIAHNVCLSRRRSSWRRGKVEAPNNFEVLQEVVPGREQVSDELIRLQDVLEEMPENQRRAILLREWQGLTYREISTELGLSQAAVETLIFRARRALAQGLEQDADTWKKRLRRGADVGGVVACAKTLLTGGGAAAIKIGATAAVVATAAVAAATAPVAPISTHSHHARVVKPSTRHLAGGALLRTSTAAAVASKTARVAHVAPAVKPLSRPRVALTHAGSLPVAASTGPRVVEDAPVPAPLATAPAALESVAPTSLSEPPPASDPPPAPAADPPAQQPSDPPQQSNGNPPDKSDHSGPTKPDHPQHPDNGHGNKP
jgi:RNA polymerase sigma factor (sigma-70 family)